MAKEIPLTQGKFAIVDDDDYERLIEHKWCYTKQGYAGAYKKGTSATGAERMLMHREICTPQKGFVVDHINMDKLDNRKENLRVVTYRENCFNRLKIKGNSRFKGVALSHPNRWVASIWIGDKRVNLGSYEKEEDAAKAYNIGALNYIGDIAYLNDVDHEGFEIVTRPVQASKYRGVGFIKKSSRWNSRITIDGRRVNLGRFDNEHDAARMYNFWALDVYGESAKLNEIQEEIN
jgi:hypothetical protein